ncbi:MAG: septum formation initiator family protein [Candidatus Paceibacterota bacterium]
MMNFWKTTVLIVITIFLGWGIYNLNLQNKELEKEIASLSNNLEEVTTENKRIQEDIHYLSNPYNLIKELKEQFNYKEEGEMMMKIITSD